MTMPTREQLTAERLNALIDVLDAQGTLPSDWAGALKDTREHGHGHDVARAARQDQGPPEFAADGGP